MGTAAWPIRRPSIGLFIRCSVSPYNAELTRERYYKMPAQRPSPWVLHMIAIAGHASVRLSLRSRC